MEMKRERHLTPRRLNRILLSSLDIYRTLDESGDDPSTAAAAPDFYAGGCCCSQLWVRPCRHHIIFGLYD